MGESLTSYPTEKFLRPGKLHSLLGPQNFSKSLKAECEEWTELPAKEQGDAEASTSQFSQGPVKESNCS